MGLDSEGTLALEESLVRVPYETMRKTFKKVQKHIERDGEYVQESVRELDKLAASGNVDSVNRKLQDMVSRVQGLKRKLSTLKTDQDNHVDLTKARIEYLNQLCLLESVESPEYEEWSTKRLDMLLVDYFLRAGYMSTAVHHAKARKIEKVVDIDVLLQCHEIEQSLRAHRTAECQAWCVENKAHLRKYRSALEFEIRLQQYIELARSKRQTEAIQYYRKYMVKSADAHLDILKQASALLAFNSDTDVAPYKDLYSTKRWEQLAAMFVETFLTFHGLPSQSALIDSLAAGIAALKTYSCTTVSAEADIKPKLDLSRAHMCPVCSDELIQLSQPLPYALHVRCHLDSDPVVLPNQRVYGREKLLSYSEKAGASPNMIIDPATGDRFFTSDLKTVFPS